MRACSDFTTPSWARPRPEYVVIGSAIQYLSPSLMTTKWSTFEMSSSPDRPRAVARSCVAAGMFTLLPLPPGASGQRTKNTRPRQKNPDGRTIYSGNSLSALPGVPTRLRCTTMPSRCKSLGVGGLSYTIACTPVLGSLNCSGPAPNSSYLLVWTGLA